MTEALDDEADLSEAMEKFMAWQAAEKLIVEGRDTDFAVARALGLPLATEEELEDWRKYMATLQRAPHDPPPGKDLQEACYLASVDGYCPQQVPRFSSGWDASFHAIEHLRKRWGFDLFTIDPILKHDNTRFGAKVWYGDPIIGGGVGSVTNWEEYEGRASTGPLAICRAIIRMGRATKSC
jgi:hypothetical protein